MNQTYYAYIMSNKSRRVYVGSTSELQPRVFKHRNGWYEDSFTSATTLTCWCILKLILIRAKPLLREKEIKGWRREKKLRLILKANPDWADLSAEWKEDESWQAIPEAKFRPVLRRQNRKP